MVQEFHEIIEYGAGKTATIHLVIDVSGNYTYLARLVLQLVVFSVLLVSLLGYFLRRAALQPLQDEIEERRRTERSLEQYTQALADSNKELESFSYSVAHDLRAPLRSITSFSQLIKQEAAGKLNADENDYLERVIKAGLHLAQLLDDLLQLARTSRIEMHVTRVDLSKLANTFLEQQQRTAPNRQVSCSVQNNVVVQGDPHLLGLVMNNLLDNAWKYTEKTEAAHIEFGVTSEHGHDVYYVRDNGVGFDMQYADKLFQPFQRLHSSGEFEGTGIGLANVKQIIHRHGGEVWANAQTGLGAAVYFTLSSPSL
jgi:light-regulated signal transduction histidine kinase (bacteriophytochrome)